MGWGTHPDTLTIATAQGKANRSGHEYGTIAWLKVYRDAYEEISKGERGAASYIAGLDQKIAAGKEPVADILF